MSYYDDIGTHALTSLVLLVCFIQVYILVLFVYFSQVYSLDSIVVKSRDLDKPYYMSYRLASLVYFSPL